MGFNNVNNFIENIETNGLDVETIKKKIKIEVYWNQLIVKKFLKDVKIDKEKIKKNLEKNLTTKRIIIIRNCI